jgi:hypothetical protein
MKTALPREHRRILESTVAQARTQAEDGAAKALKALAVGAKEPQTHATPEQKKLRVQLRAHGRALGDAAASDGMQATAHLVTEIAYEHWHRMLFARFLAESNLLMHPDGYPVSMADCKEDAATCQATRPAANGKWLGATPALCCPTCSVSIAPCWPWSCLWRPSKRWKPCWPNCLRLCFKADDSLGWSYEFWQAHKQRRRAAADETGWH